MAALLALGAVRAPAGAAEPLDPPTAATAPRLSASAAVLLDATTGAVLYARNAHQRRDPASTTKIMTALLAFEYGRLDDLVTVSRRAAATPGSSMGLRAGQVFALSDLLTGLMLASGNDAAVAIAEHVAGSVEAFVDLMNERARQLGLRDTRFRNPHGLTAPGHFTTAYDLAVLTQAALRYDGFRRVVCQRVGTACERSADRSVRLHNTNDLLWMYEFAEGVKTGTTSAAGRCLVASASRRGHRLIAVLLNAPDRFRDARDLLAWGFEAFTLRRVLAGGERVGEIGVRGGRDATVAAVAAEDLWVVAPRAAWGTSRLRWEVDLAGSLTAPVARHAAVGRVSVRLDGRELAAVRLVAEDDVAAAGPGQGLLRRLEHLLRP